MPQIFVTTNSREGGRGVVLFQERVNVLDLESDHSSAQLLERLGWAIVDADDLEHTSEEKSPAPFEHAPHPRTSSPRGVGVPAPPPLG